MKKKTVIYFLVIILIGTIGYLKFWNDNLFEIRKENQTHDAIYSKGEKLYIKNCASCHSTEMDKASTGPALGGITILREKKWLYHYTRNSYQMFESGDSIAKTIRQKYGAAMMTSFPKLSNSDLDAIYYFVEKKYEIDKRTSKH